jgi:hypothetical protein
VVDGVLNTPNQPLIRETAFLLESRALARSIALKVMSTNHAGSDALVRALLHSRTPLFSGDRQSFVIAPRAVDVEVARSGSAEARTRGVDDATRLVGDVRWDMPAEFDKLSFMDNGAAMSR